LLNTLLIEWSTPVPLWAGVVRVIEQESTSLGTERATTRTTTKEMTRNFAVAVWVDPDSGTLRRFVARVNGAIATTDCVRVD
jgi:hypothetical protein